MHSVSRGFQARFDWRRNIVRTFPKQTRARPTTMSTSKCKKGKGRNKDKTEVCDEERTLCNFHDFTASEIDILRKSLLTWYDSQQRNLPWREIDTTDENARAYGVWVSEIMLQQTQVATVIDYYKRWMKMWPSVQDLAAASVEEVNTLWSGLGYYSRGRRLLEGAQKVVNEMDGKLPDTAEDLQKLLPGVGRYTAGAIASIAFGQVTGLVDGNVMRVLSRLRLIGAYITQQNVIDKFWALANEVVDSERPGDFNQAVMELGATVCTPKTPNCSQCPVKSLCKAYAKVEHGNNESLRSAVKRFTKTENNIDIPDIENAVPDCSLCLPSDQTWENSQGVLNLPRKPPKAKARQEELYVLVIKKSKNCASEDNQYWMIQRPEKGLLAGLWEFPVRSCSEQDKDVEAVLKEDFNIDLKPAKDLKLCGQVTHMFSHIHHIYHVLSLDVEEDVLDIGALNPHQRDSKWLSEKEMKGAAISTGMRKVFKLSQDTSSTKTTLGKRKCESKSKQTSKKSQPSIASFFKPSTVKR